MSCIENEPLNGRVFIKEYDVELWYKDGVLHRDDGPAVIDYNGLRQWYKHGVLHREDGPAIIYPDGTNKYFKYGVEFSAEQWWDSASEELKFKILFKEENA